jgi:predicted P-loop ATPase
MSIDHAREHVVQVSVGFDAVEFAGFNQRTDDRPTFTTAVTACKQVVLATERQGTDSTLDRVGVEFNAAIMQEARQAFPARERVTDRLGRDREQWRRWAIDNIGCNFGVVAFASDWIICDIDTSGGEAGDAEARTLWAELCASWGLPGPLPFHVRSQSGGFHVYFQVPPHIDASTLRQPDAIKGRINVRCIGYTVAAGSQFEGRPYTLLNDIPPHPAPAALVEHCTRAPRNLDGVSLPGNLDKGDVATMLRWMAEKEMFASYEDWFQAGMALKLDGDDGSLWDICHDGTVSPDVAASKWESFSTEPDANSVTLLSLMKRAHAAGWTSSIRKSTEHMFQGVAQLATLPLGSGMPTVPDAPSIVPPLPHGATGHSMIGGDPATVWASLDRFANPAPGDWANAKVLLRRLKYEVRYNAWTERPEICEAGEAWADRQDWHLDKIAGIGSSHPHNYRPSESILRRAIDSLARENTVDPARELLDNLQAGWDGQARLHSWLSQACGVPYDAYHQAVGQCILLGLVARIRCPGVKFDLMPVLVSEKQGTSKSTLARMFALDDAWFIENLALGESAKELVLLLADKSVAEISEMRTRGEVNAVKAMVSATHDEGRPAYGRATVKRPRRNIFWGTTNTAEFLEDPTGGRRFLPIMVQGEIDLEFVRTHRAQLIGEAATLQSRGVDINLPREVWELAGEHQAAATSQSNAEVLLTDWFGGDEPCWISSANLVLLLRLALGREVSRGVYAPVMTKLGFVNKTRRVGKEVPRVWVRAERELDANASGFGAQLSHSGRPTLQQLFPPSAPAASVPPLPY